jgi:hypothetical protein
MNPLCRSAAARPQTLPPLAISPSAAALQWGRPPGLRPTSRSARPLPPSAKLVFNALAPRHLRPLRRRSAPRPNHDPFSGWQTLRRTGVTSTTPLGQGDRPLLHLRRPRPPRLRPPHLASGARRHISHRDPRLRIVRVDRFHAFLLPRHPQSVHRNLSLVRCPHRKGTRRNVGFRVRMVPGSHRTRLLRQRPSLHPGRIQVRIPGRRPP